MSINASVSDHMENHDININQLRQMRSTAKGNVTRKANRLNELIISFSNVDLVKNASDELHGVWTQFELVHYDYHRLIKDEQEIKESKVYHETVEELVSEQPRSQGFSVRTRRDTRKPWSGPVNFAF